MHSPELTTMKKEYVNSSFVHELVEETAMIALSLTETAADPDSEVLVKGEENNYRTTTVDWEDWD